MALKLENNLGNKFSLTHANNASDINLTSKDLASTKLVDSIAELKLISGSTADKLEVLGYYEKGDGGGGLFYWDSESTEVDNGGTVIQATGVTTGRWKRVFSGAVNVKWFGILPSSSSIENSDRLDGLINILKKYPEGSSSVQEVYIPEGTYNINRTINLSNLRHVIFSGKGLITGNFDNFLIAISNSMYVYFKNIQLSQANNGLNSGCLYIKDSYITGYSEMNLAGGHKVIEHYGNNNIFDKISCRYGYYGFYTSSENNNSQNVLRACAIERNDYNIYFDSTNYFFGIYNIDSCYIEGSNIANIYIKSNHNIEIKNCLINNIILGSTCILFDGEDTLYRRSLALNNNQFLNAKNNYVFKSNSSTVNVFGKLEDSNLIYASEKFMYDSVTSIRPICFESNSYRREIDIYNIKHLVDTDKNGVPDGFTLISGNSSTIDNTIGLNGLNSIVVTNGRLKSTKFKLEKGVSYTFSCISKLVSGTRTFMNVIEIDSSGNLLYDIMGGVTGTKFNTYVGEVIKLLFDFVPKRDMLVVLVPTAEGGAGQISDMSVARNGIAIEEYASL